jgi:hypothetical protein
MWPGIDVAADLDTFKAWLSDSCCLSVQHTKTHERRGWSRPLQEKQRCKCNLIQVFDSFSFDTLENFDSSCCVLQGELPSHKSKKPSRKGCFVARARLVLDQNVSAVIFKNHDQALETCTLSLLKSQGYTIVFFFLFEKSRE